MSKQGGARFVFLLTLTVPDDGALARPRAVSEDLDALLRAGSSKSCASVASIRTVHTAACGGIGVEVDSFIVGIPRECERWLPRLPRKLPALLRCALVCGGAARLDADELKLLRRAVQRQADLRRKHISFLNFSYVCPEPVSAFSVLDSEESGARKGSRIRTSAATEVLALRTVPSDLTTQPFACEKTSSL